MIKIKQKFIAIVYFFKNKMLTFYKDYHIINVAYFLGGVYLFRKISKLTQKKNHYGLNLQAEETLKKKKKIKNNKKEIKVVKHQKMSKIQQNMSKIMVTENKP